MAEHVDVIVLGMGPGGEYAAGELAEAGLSVVGVEQRLVGGECPYWACVPSKMMIRAGNALAEAHRVDGLAGSALVRPDWTPVAARIRDDATDNWDDSVAVQRFVEKGGEFVRGHGQLDGPGRVRVGDRIIQATQGVVLATGTAPAIPPIPGLAGTPYWTNRQAIEATRPPDSLIVLGGGPVGVELGQVFARFGSSVSIVEASERVLSREEPESSEFAERSLMMDGVTVHTGRRAVDVDYNGQEFTLTLDNGEKLRSDVLLVATGRRADLGALGVDTVGVDPRARWVPVDERMRVDQGLWAVGDITGKGEFTHVSMYQAGIVIRDILHQPGPPADYRALPRVTFLDPEIGAAGLTEQQARSQGINVRVGYTDLATSARGWIHKAGDGGFIKLVEDADRGVLCGATSAGPSGGEVLFGLCVAIHGEVPTDKLRHMIYAYPTFHRAINNALEDLS